MRHILLTSLALAAALPAAGQTKLAASDQASVFRAAGFKLQARQWQRCGDPGTASYSPGAIESVRDLNGDGRPEAIVVEGSVYCFGNTGTGFTIVSKEADGTWKQIADGTGIATVLAAKGVGGWPDIEIGGPGFCFPVQRWNGRAYATHRHQYQGKPCRPQR